MDDHSLPSEDSYDDPVAKRRRKGVDGDVFKRPIKSIGLRACVILRKTDSVRAAIEAMRAAGIGSVLVTGDENKLVGIFTERDALNRLALGEVDPKTTSLDLVMHEKPETLTLDDEIGYALRLMSHGGYRRIPLVDKSGRPVGVVSVRDIVDFIADLYPDDILTLPPDPRSIAKKPEGA